MKRSFALLLLFLVPFFAPIDATAQQRARTAPATPAPAAPQPAAPEAPDIPLAYEPELLRLAEALGVIAYVSRLCDEPASDGWHQRAQQIIEAEGATQSRKDRLAGAFNRGYFGHQAMHRACTDATRLVSERQRSEARRITQDISTRFGG
jgi:uncharacterized protein (TIGR02301 family)